MLAFSGSVLIHVILIDSYFIVNKLHLHLYFPLFIYMTLIYMFQDQLILISHALL